MAEDYIIGKDINRGDEARLKQGLVIKDGGKISRETYNHEEIMDQMIKAIEFTKMDKKMRAVLLLRLIHGYTIQRMQIYLFLHGHLTGNSHDELVAIEEEGKRLVKETLQNHSIQEIVASINANSRVIKDLRNEFATPKPFLGLQ
jgi:divalent metal cation (Fe/Co/Zn/Cd) transporter